MKAFFKYFGFLLGLACLASCTSVDYPDRYKETTGVPTVHYVRYADRDVIITQASMEEIVCIVGDNLTSVHNIYFNDQEAVLNSSYMTANTIVLSVPKNLPTVTDNKMHLVTRDGSEVLYDFKVLPPAPKISGMSCEWAKPGEVVTITGSYLFAPLTVSFPGADEVEVSDAGGDSFSVTVPAGAQPGKIKVVTSSGTAQSVFQYMDTRGILFDFDGTRGGIKEKNGWNGHASNPADDSSIDGGYFQFGDGATNIQKDDGTVNWNEDWFSFPYWPGSWNDPENYADAALLTDFADFTDWKNMALKFECFIPSANPWKGGPMQIMMAGVDKVSGGNGGIKDIYGNTVAGANNTYMSGEDNPRALWTPWLQSGSFDTGDKWVTITIPFSEFTYTWNGAACVNSLRDSDFTSLWMFLAGGGDKFPGEQSAPIIKIDNVRAVPYK